MVEVVAVMTVGVKFLTTYGTSKGIMMVVVGEVV